MAEALPANIDWKSAFLKGVSQFWPNFHVVGARPPRTNFCTDGYTSEFLTTLSPNVFTQSSSVADFLQVEVKCDFRRKTAI